MSKNRIPSSLKPQRGLSSEVLSHRRRQRNALKREHEQFLKRREQSVRQKIKEIGELNSETSRKTSWGRAIINATADGQNAVMRSQGISAGIAAGTNWWTKTLKAFTDFEDIYVRYPAEGLPEPEDIEGSRKFAIEVRGILQHEIGHLRFTLPYNKFLEAIPVELKESLMTQSRSQYAWNVLEDQRMETLVVDAVPRIASYFETMVVKHILIPVRSSAFGDTMATDEQLSSSWILVSNRMYLKPELRAMSKRMFTSAGYNADQWYDIVESYKTATAYEAMAHAVLAAAKFIEKMSPSGVPNSTTDHEQQIDNSRTPPDPDAVPTPCEPANEQEEQQDEPSTGDSPSEEVERGEGTAGSKDGEHPEEADPAQSGGYDPSPKDLRDLIGDVLSDNFHQQSEHQEITEALANARERVGVGGGLPEAPQAGKPMTPEQEDMAYRIAAGMEQALNDFVTESQPAWLRRQERGVIDPIAFRTKEVGALDYHRYMDGDYASGIDLHFSMLCDVSGSMQGKEIEHLSIGMYATAIACKRIGIGTTFVLWSGPDNTGKVWVDGNPTPVIWHADGGTNPTMALNDLDNHNEEGASNHLVLVFTDGAWDSEARPLSDWSAPGRYIVLSRLVSLLSLSDDLHFKADAYASVTDVADLPDKLTAAIHSVLSSK
jgi:hypothetical protein